MKKYLLLIMPLIGGIIIGLLSNTTNYNLFVPSIVFPIVWTILYILMGISSYIVYENRGELKYFYIQLALNYMWPLIYFNLDLKLLALFIIIALMYSVIKMIKEFKNSSLIASKLQIPYLIWLMFALFLNILSL